MDEGLKAISIDPYFSIGYENVAWAYVDPNRPLDADRLLGQAAERQIEVTQFSLVRYASAFLQRDSAAMTREVTRRQAKLQTQGVFEHQEALTCAYQGRVKEAQRLSDRAVTLARQGGLLERAAQFAGVGAVGTRSTRSRMKPNEARRLRCRCPEAVTPMTDWPCARSSPEIHEEPGYRIGPGRAVPTGHLGPVQLLAGAPRALHALNDDDAGKALHMTQAASPYELALPGAFFTAAFFGALYPVYVRGLAYARLGQLNDASAEFQKVLDHPGLVSIDPIARLRWRVCNLPGCYPASRDRDKAAVVYQQFPGLWDEADSELPVLQQAKREYANLGAPQGT